MAVVFFYFLHYSTVSDLAFINSYDVRNIYQISYLRKSVT